MLKNKVGYGASSNSVNAECGGVQDNAIANQDNEKSYEKDNIVSESNVPQRKQDLNDAMDNNLDKLDSLIDKAERAHYAMEDQRKQMKKVLK